HATELPLITLTEERNLRVDSEILHAQVLKDSKLVSKNLTILRKTVQSIRFLGKSERIFDTLRLVFLDIDIDARLDCTFDPFTDGCQSPPGSLLIVGTLRDNFGNSKPFFQVDEKGIILSTNNEVMQLISEPNRISSASRSTFSNPTQISNATPLQNRLK